jgi:8-oxo-dGTP pyrophosphatase MutT (NUDIX family)
MPGLPQPKPMSERQIWKPDVTVAAIVERDGRFLFIEERVRGQLVLNQPAGHLEQRESLVDALVRETLEESGWQVEPTGLVGIYLWTSPVDGVSFMRVTLAATPIRHDVDRALDSGIERALWLSPDELAAHPVPHRSPMVVHSLRDYLANGAGPMDRLQHVPFAAAP